MSSKPEDLSDYYQIARKIQKMDRQSAALELRKIHQQMGDQLVELVAEEIREAKEQGKTIDEIEKMVRNIRIEGAQFADDRMHLRRLEAILYVLRERKALIASKSACVEAYNAGHGVDIASSNATLLEIELQKGKYMGE